jgi:hypothetical protein
MEAPFQPYSATLAVTTGSNKPDPSGSGIREYALVNEAANLEYILMSRRYFNQLNSNIN